MTPVGSSFVNVGKTIAILQSMPYEERNKAIEVLTLFAETTIKDELDLILALTFIAAAFYTDENTNTTYVINKVSEWSKLNQTKQT